MTRSSLNVLAVAAGLGALMTMTIPAVAQEAGRTTLGVSVTTIDAVAKGWSIRKEVLDHSVYNEKGEEIGTVADVIVSPSEAISYAIVSDGGYLGIAEHYVAVPVNQFKVVGGKYQLPGATKDALKNAPAFRYTK